MNIHRLRYLIGFAGAMVAAEHAYASTGSPADSVVQHQWYFAPSTHGGNINHDANVYKFSPFLDPNEYLRRIAEGYRGNLALDADLMNHAKHPQAIQNDELFDALKYRKMLEQRQREESNEPERGKDKPGKGDAYEQLLRPITGFSTGPMMWYPAKKASTKSEDPSSNSSESQRSGKETENAPKRIPVAPKRSSAVVPSVNDFAHNAATPESEVVVRRRSSPAEEITVPPAFRASLETSGAQIGNSINRTGLSLSTSQTSRAIAPSAPIPDRKAERSLASLDRSGQESGSVQKVVSLQPAPTNKPNMEQASLAATAPTPANSSATVGLAILKDECKAKTQTVEPAKSDVKEEAKSWTQKTSSTADDKYKIRFR